MFNRLLRFAMLALLIAAISDTASAQLINDVQEMRAIIRKGISRDRDLVLYRLGNVDWKGQIPDHDALAEYIKAYSAPGTWGVQGGRIHKIDRFPASFLILQTRDAHKEVNALIGSLPKNLRVRTLPTTTSANGLFFLQRPHIKVKLSGDPDWLVALNADQLANDRKAKKTLATLRALVAQNGGPLYRFLKLFVRVYHLESPTAQQESDLKKSIDLALEPTGIRNATIDHQTLLPKQTFPSITARLHH